MLPRMRAFSATAFSSILLWVRQNHVDTPQPVLSKRYWFFPGASQVTKLLKRRLCNFGWRHGAWTR